MLDDLYENIGGKIKSSAKWIFIVEAVGSIIAAFVIPAASGDPNDFVLESILIAILGPVVAYVSSWILYGFGKLIEDVETIRNKKPPVIKIEAEPIKQPVSKTNVKEEKTSSPKASETTSNNIGMPSKKEQVHKEKSQNTLPCPYCGEDLAFMDWDDDDFKEKQTCPLCGNEILFNQ